jgi:hypothetical protein
MDLIFQIVYTLLKLISELTGFSYNEVNIIVYYIVLPFVYVFLADKIIKSVVLRIVYLTVVAVVLLLIPDFSAFSDRLFQASVDFLLSLRILGWNYVVSSVLVCVAFPGIIFLVMLHFAYPGLFSRLFGSSGKGNPIEEDQNTTT